ncbi:MULTISPECIES: MarR family transcriptional regulator [unclassified Pseudovibrio]|uniref:MarR family winged helix-turn-helix transcriptional regulator n=1 Tax=unclassified Pseudovibrio TaxID=2627060 RepID=UPI0007AEE38E|nr:MULTISPECIES: MarR family transcriptional regulator [unclassified Pseudovibrio]KZK96141.1 MarR family protein [Pseudovibrio sp. W74]KZL10352.1 MarR family protein [Pseudovibrio sp. Ad14]
MQDNYLADQLSAISTTLEDASLQAYGGLPVSSVAVLMLLNRRVAPSLGFIADQIRLSHSATVRVIDRLEKKQLVKRVKRQGRNVKVGLTFEGKRRANELGKARTHTAEALLKNLDTDQRATLSEIFSKMLKGLDHSASARFCSSKIETEAST